MCQRDATRLSKKDRIYRAGVALPYNSFQGLQMATHSPGTIAVIFIAQRTDYDDAGYSAASATMDRIAAQQPGYIGINSVRGCDGLGITISYWANDAAARAWRDHPEHAAIREQGRNIWYVRYDLHVAEVSRSYDWVKPS
jgi:heme-degrading monooxygenase HmoA